MFTSWRDPKPYEENGTYYCLNCARQSQGPFLRRGSVQLMTSTDLMHWRIEAPLYSPYQSFDVECPQLLKIGKYYYIIGALMEEQTQRYWLSEHILGPYRSLPNNLLMPDHSHYAGRVAAFQGRWAYACWNSAMQDGPSPFEGLLAYEGEQMRYVPSLLELRQENDGRLRLAPWEAWQSYRIGLPLDLAGGSPSPLCGNPLATVGEASLAVDSGFEVAAFGQVAGDFLLEGVIHMEAARSGIAFYLNNDSEGYFLEFSPAEYRVRLVKYLRVRRKPTGVPWFHYEVRQQNVLEPSCREHGISLRLLCVGGELECAIEDKVVLSTVSTARRSGKIGLFAECGKIWAERLTMTTMRVPGNV